MCLLAADLGWDKYTLKALGDKGKANGWEVRDVRGLPVRHPGVGRAARQDQADRPGLIAISDLDPADVKTFIDQFRADPTNAIVDAGYCASIKEFAKIMGKNGEGVTGYSCAAILPNERGDKFIADFDRQVRREARAQHHGDRGTTET